ncbi:hypothetical protein [Cryptosporangium aurantiacum]|uniref:Uncharacterized protein n=1 Tax=Cryptosporangium aurantiacum TaxID=134849 RepID=A0A1M7RF20_9ACTN|nr:hypothetical protein [Cryptosporangium aurantiacum]SHN44628.1 hypothetical protein SAMN05443668_110283 [Cryptosporangium aurantiacum]
MFDNDEPTDDWFDHIGLGGESYQSDRLPAGRDENNEGVASAIHGAVALLQALHADHEAVPAAVTSWAAVYGTATVEPELDELQQEFRARRPRTIADAFMAGAVAMGDAISGPTSDLVSQQLAAHVKIETELLERLAQATDRPVRDVLAHLEEWATSETVDPR